MAKLENYKGTIKIIDGLEPMGEDFPLMDAHYVQTGEDGKRLDEEIKDLKASANRIMKHTAYPDNIQRANRDMRGWYRIAETSGNGLWSNIFHLQVEVLRSARSSDVIFTVERMNYQDTPSIGVLSYGNQTAMHNAVDGFRVVYFKGMSGEISYLEVHVNQNATPDNAWDGTGKSTGYSFTVETHFHSTNNWNLITPMWVPEEVEDGLTIYEKSPLTSAWSQVTANVDDINNLARRDYVDDEIADVDDKIAELRAVVNNSLSTKSVDILEVLTSSSETAQHPIQLALDNAVKYDLVCCGWLFNSGGAYILPDDIVHYISFDIVFVPDSVGARTGNITSIVARKVVVDSPGFESSGYEIKSVSASRGLIEQDVRSPEQTGYEFYLHELYFTFQVTIVAITPDGDEVEDTLTYTVLSDNDCESSLGGTITILKNEATAPLTATAYDLRTQSIDRQLTACIEEAIARRKAERANKTVT